MLSIYAVFPLHIFWTDMEHLIKKKKMEIALQLNGFDILIHFSDLNMDKAYLVPLLYIYRYMGTFRILK